MATVYVDLDLGTGSNDGTSWANAYQSFGTMVAAVSAGDVVYVQGDETGLGSTTYAFPNADYNNPVIVLGCKSGTSAEPPTQSDLVPGRRTGDPSRAWEQTAGNAAPSVNCDTGSGIDLTINGSFYIYGVKFYTKRAMFLNDTDAFAVCEECVIGFSQSEYASLGSLRVGNSGDNGHRQVFKNCEIGGPTENNGIIGYNGGMIDFIGCVWAANTSSPSSEILSGAAYCAGGVYRFVACDFSTIQAHIIAPLNAIGGRDIQFWNCRFHASSALTSGVPDANIPVKFHNCSTATGKGAGQSFLEFEQQDINGSIVVETTIVRASGADDGGSGGYSLAFTGTSGDTIPNYHGLAGPWMAFKVAGDGATSKTVSVYINNDSGFDLNNDDVWLEVMYPSEAGTANFDFATTQMGLLATPSAVTDDASSDWGGSDPGNGQVLQASGLVPDYTGVAYCRIVVATGTTDTVYADPKPVVS